MLTEKMGGFVDGLVEKVKGMAPGLGDLPGLGNFF